MVFDVSDEKAIRAALSQDCWTGRWEGRYHGSPISIWVEGERGSRRVCFTARAGVRLYHGDGKLIREVMERIDDALRSEPKDVTEAWTPVQVEEPTTRRARSSSPARQARTVSGTRPHLMGHGLCRVLQWMGAHGFSIYDATNALEHHGLSAAISKKTISRAMDKGRNPERDGIEIATLPENVIEALVPFRDLARREG